jgi:tetratricopeptide (TPR) repeat protein
LAQRLEGYLVAAERLAPSDEMVPLRLAQLHHHPVTTSRMWRGSDPFQGTQQYLDKALAIAPDSRQVNLESAVFTFYQGRRELSRGLDPSALLVKRAQTLGARVDRALENRDDSGASARENLCRLWALAAEADHRYGRDPRPALDQVGLWGKDLLGPGLIQGSLLRAQSDLEQDRNPEAAFMEVTRLLQALQTVHGAARFAWSECAYAEGWLEVGRWQYQSGKLFKEALQAAEVCLGNAQNLDPRFPEIFHLQTHLQTLQARIALAQGRDAGAKVRSALSTAQEGLKTYDESTRLLAAYADALLADAEIRSARGGNPGASFSLARQALAKAQRLNPRDYRLVLLQAQMDLQRGDWEQRQGSDPSSSRASAVRACRRGLALKADEPTFKRLLARIGGSRAAPHLAAQ